MGTPRFLSLLLALFLLCGCASAPALAESEPYTTELLAMDTVMKLTIYGPEGQEAAEQASVRIQDLEARLSTTDEHSEIYAANHSGGAPAAVSEDTAALLDRALQLCASTGGALDVTIYPVVRAWGFTTGAYQVPEPGCLEKLLEHVDYRQVSLDTGSLTLPEGVEIDLGAVAKGYTGDQLMELFAEAGITSAIVELGGNVQALGAKPDGSPWRVGIQSPEDDGYAGILEIVDQAVVTSGGYQRYFEKDGAVYWHILDPANGQPAWSGLASVTIVADEGVVCDALSTALFVMGTEGACRYWQETGGFDFILLEESGKMVITEGLENCFTPTGAWEGRPMEIVRSNVASER